MSFVPVKRLVQNVNDRRNFSDRDEHYIGLEHISSWTGALASGVDTPPEGLVGVFKRGDILFGKLRPYLAKVAAPGFDGVCSTEALVLRPSRKSDTRFLRYCLSSASFIDRVNSATFGVKMPRASWEIIGSQPIWAPDLPTQTRIADFLDRETARIDALIELRDRFAHKVAEAREAVVSSLLVGIPEGAGIGEEKDWLSGLPASARKERAKFHLRERDGRSETGSEELLTVSHLTGVTKRSEKDVNMFLAESNEGYKLVYPGDIVINTMWAWMGAMGVSKDHGLISPSYGVYQPTSDAFLPDYLDLLVRSKPFVAEANRRSKGIHSSRLRLYPDAFLDMLLPIPSRQQQIDLLAQIQRRAAREDALAAKNAQSTELLREYRAALITAAVTGQIDVDAHMKEGRTSASLDKIASKADA